MINPPLASTAIGVVHYSRSGMASGINNTFRQVGIATGIAGLGAVFQHQVTSKTTAALVTTAPGREVVRGRTRPARRRARLRRSLTARPPPPPRRARRARPRLPRRLHRRVHEILIIAAVDRAGRVPCCAFALVRGRDFVAAGEGEGAAPGRRTPRPRAV